MEKEGTGKKILVVDDKADARRLARKVLALHGYDTIEAATGEDAVDMARRELPDLILMDVRLPRGIDGLEATRRIKAIPQLADIPILAMTASVGQEDLQKALEAGCCGFARKPVDIDELPKQVAQYISRASCKGDVLPCLEHHLR